MITSPYDLHLDTIPQTPLLRKYSLLHLQMLSIHTAAGSLHRVLESHIPPVAKIYSYSNSVNRFVVIKHYCDMRHNFAQLKSLSSPLEEVYLSEVISVGYNHKRLSCHSFTFLLTKN